MTRRARKYVHPCGVAALEMVTALAQAWSPTQGYALLRAVVIHAVYAEIARAYGMRAPSIAQAMPEIPASAVAEMRERIAALRPAELTPEDFGAVHETLSGYTMADGAIVPSDGRKRRGVHFTPPEMAAQVVARTLEPLLTLVEPGRTLELRLCDPAVGAGAFLLAVVRELAPRVLDAGLAQDVDEAKRLVAVHCCYGVDTCRFAVHVTKLALTLECRADRMPRDWLDGNIKRGDALVGVSLDQIRAFDWREGRSQPLLAIDALITREMGRAVAARRERLAELAQAARG